MASKVGGDQEIAQNCDTHIRVGRARLRVDRRRDVRKRFAGDP
jgi:hypothetical protein